MSDSLDEINAFLETGEVPASLTPSAGRSKPSEPLAEMRPEHRALLLNSAVTEAVIGSSGIQSTTTGIRFPWSDGVGATVWQTRPDKPVADADGKLIKYVFPKGAHVPLNRLRDGETYERLILAEGTKQQYAVLSHAPADFGVYGMSGCWGWANSDLSFAENRDVFVLLDGDIESNVKVYEAAAKLSVALKREGAKTVRFVLTSARGTDGVDDVLASYAEDKRARSLKRWLTQASEKLPKRPKGKRKEDGDGPDPALRFFYQSDTPLRFDPKKALDELLPQYPAALTAENTVALYSGGRYRVTSLAFTAMAVQEFGSMFTPSIASNLESFFKGHLEGRDIRLPEHSTYRLLNCTNGMVDLTTGKLLPHDPKYLSTVQIPVAWNPEAKAPVYEAWLRACCDDQVDDLEETASTMLDPTRPPSKAMFLFGPSRSGKSTFLRILKAMAGAENISAVTLHNLADDKFAAANVYGKMLNVAADLSSKHVEDLSMFKMILGEDVVNANRKYGAQFTFTNQALFAFSANELPTVSESSNAYTERMKPFAFPHSFAGREDLTLWDKLEAELPGILVRWVKAYQRWIARGRYLPTDAAVRARFEQASDRVVQFVAERCKIVKAVHGQTMAAGDCTGRRALAQAFNLWADRNGGHKMGERKIFDRLRGIEGVVEVRDSKRGHAFNIVVKGDDDADNDDLWGPEDNGLDGDDGGDPWGAPRDPEPTPAIDVTPVTDDVTPEAQTVTDDVTPVTESSDLRDALEETVTQTVTDAPHVAAGVDPMAAITGGGFHMAKMPEETVTQDVTQVSPVTPETETPETEMPEESPRFPEGLAEKLAGQVVGFDIETRSKEELYQGGFEGPYGRLGGVITEDGEIFQTADMAELIEVLYGAAKHYSHNGLAFDLPALALHHGGDIDRLNANAVDTRVLAVLDEPPLSRGGTKPEAYDLDAVAKKFGHEGKTDDVKKLAAQYGGFHLIPLDVLAPYLDGDLIALKFVYDELVRRMS